MRRVKLVDSEVVGQTRYSGVHFGAAERFVVGLLAGGHLHEWRPGQEHLRTFLDHHHVIGHPGNVGTPRGGVAEHQRDGRDAGGRQPGQVAEHLTAGDEDLFLGGQIRPAGFHQRNDGKPVLQGDLVGPQYLPQCPRVAGATFDRRIVGDDQAFHTADHADAGDRAGADRESAAPGREGAELQERGVRVDEQLDAFPRGQLVAGVVTLDVLGAAAGERFGDLGVDLIELGLGRRCRLGIRVSLWIECGLQCGHDHRRRISAERQRER